MNRTETNVKVALEWRKHWYVKWQEPWHFPGVSDCQCDYAHVELRMSVEDCIKYQRGICVETWKKKHIEPIEMTDEQLLWDFIVVHWAELRMYE